MFAHRLGYDMADRFAAIAPVAGTLAKDFNCAPDGSASISIMHLHGGRAAVIPASPQYPSDLASTCYQG